MEKINARKISDQVFDRISEKIRSLEWPSGFRLPSENDLAKGFGVSRNSVRSALQRLVALGIIESRNGEGSFVRHFSPDLVMKSMVSMLTLNPKEIIALLEFRKGIEIVSCELAAERRSDQEAASLDAVIEEMRRSCAERRFEEYAEHDYEFHLRIAAMSKNFFIENILIMLRGPISSHFEEMSRRFDMGHYLDNHERVCGAIRNKDAQSAGELMKRSLEESIDDVKALEGGPTP